MIKWLLIAALVAVAMAGYDHGHHGHHGWGGWGRHYSGWANVNVWQTPWAYNYGLKESGKGYNKYIWQGADASHKGWGWGGGY